jgi:hypothetical protein
MCKRERGEREKRREKGLGGRGEVGVGAGVGEERGGSRGGEGDLYICINNQIRWCR